MVGTNTAAANRVAALFNLAMALAPESRPKRRPFSISYPKRRWPPRAWTEGKSHYAYSEICAQFTDVLRFGDGKETRLGLLRTE
jgi:hypothetical protein